MDERNKLHWKVIFGLLTLVFIGGLACESLQKLFADDPNTLSVTHIFSNVFGVLLGIAMLLISIQVLYFERKARRSRQAKMTMDEMINQPYGFLNPRAELPKWLVKEMLTGVSIAFLIILGLAVSIALFFH